MQRIANAIWGMITDIAVPLRHPVHFVAQFGLPLSAGSQNFCNVIAILFLAQSGMVKM